MPNALAAVRWDDLAELIREDYRQNNRRSTDRLERSLRHLEGFFGGWPVPAIDEAAVQRFITYRLKAGYANATVNRELSALKRAFRLGYRQKLVGRIPDIRMLQENNVRTGFLSYEDLWALLEVAPPSLRPFIEALYVTGWRKGELLSRNWSHVDLQAGWLRLEPGETKSGEGRMFPITAHLRRVLEEQRAQRYKVNPTLTPLFFRYGGPRKGQRIRNPDKAWRRTRERAGLPDLTIHDFRRTAVRNLVHAGVPDVVAMKMTGHRTRSVFDRYAIVDHGALRDAAKLMDGQSRVKAVPEGAPAMGS